MLFVDYLLSEINNQIMGIDNQIVLDNDVNSGNRFMALYGVNRSLNTVAN